VARPIRIGLTGGIGSGKSTVATLLAQLGACIIDADAISRELTAPGGLAMPAIQQVFGSEFVTPGGALDRDRMRTLVFANPSAKQRLEGIIHPMARQEIWRQAQVAQDADRPCLVFDVPLLIESNSWKQQMDRVLVVDCSIETQIKRVMNRNALERTAVEAIIATQASRNQRLRAADSVISNDCQSLVDLGQQVQALAPEFGLSLHQKPDIDT
jgi:dephospho-CoA kinase